MGEGEGAGSNTVVVKKCVDAETHCVSGSPPSRISPYPVIGVGAVSSRR